MDAELIDRIKKATDLRSLVETHARKSRLAKAFHCCFHDDSSPSLFVDSNRGLFYCFGCGAGGDAISFIRYAENLSFPDAIKRLAHRSGIDIPGVKLSKKDYVKIKRRLRQREKKIATLNFQENLAKGVENVIYSTHREVWLALPQRKPSPNYTAKDYVKGHLKEEELEEAFERLDRAVETRKATFEKMRHEIYA